MGSLLAQLHCETASLVCRKQIFYNDVRCLIHRWLILIKYSLAIRGQSCNPACWRQSLDPSGTIKEAVCKILDCKFILRPCRGSGGSSPASHRWGLGSLPAQSMWDLWWKNWHWEWVFSRFFGITLSISFHRGSILTYYNLGHWWPQFRDVFSPHRYEYEHSGFYAENVGSKSSSHINNVTFSVFYCNNNSNFDGLILKVGSLTACMSNILFRNGKGQTAWSM